VNVRITQFLNLEYWQSCVKLADMLVKGVLPIGKQFVEKVAHLGAGHKPIKPLPIYLCVSDTRAPTVERYPREYERFKAVLATAVTAVPTALKPTRNKPTAFLMQPEIMAEVNLWWHRPFLPKFRANAIRP
jgi:hypothetical protein